jgi:hypothetical protein
MILEGTPVRILLVIYVWRSDIKSRDRPSASSFNPIRLNNGIKNPRDDAFEIRVVLILFRSAVA